MDGEPAQAWPGAPPHLGAIPEPHGKPLLPPSFSLRRNAWNPDARSLGRTDPLLMIPIITLLILGVVLLYLETVLPGLIVGILGFICLMAAVILGYRNYGYQAGSFILAGVLAGLMVGAFCWLKFFPDSRMAHKFISQGSVGELGVAKPELLHATGAALSQLRPSGTANIDGQRVDVVTEGGLIEAGTAVKVVTVEGARIVVRAI